MSENLEHSISILCTKIDTLCETLEGQQKVLIDQNKALVSKLIDRKVIPVSVFLVVVISIAGIFATAKALNNIIEKVPPLLGSAVEAVTDSAHAE